MCRFQKSSAALLALSASAISREAINFVGFRLRCGFNAQRNTNPEENELMAYSEKLWITTTIPAPSEVFLKKTPTSELDSSALRECGDVMKLQMRINPETQVIEEARFKTVGCGSARLPALLWPLNGSEARPWKRRCPSKTRTSSANSRFLRSKSLLSAGRRRY